MARKLEKTKCHTCNNKFTPRVKSARRYDVHVQYTLCNTCGTVYPLDATDGSIRQMKTKLDTLREQTFNSDCTLCAEEKEANVREIQYLVHKIKTDTKAMIQLCKPLYMTFGDRVKVIPW